MKPFIQKLPLSENSSFVARTYKTPNFETEWHQHEEYELILITGGMGLSFVGNYVGEFQPGDIFLLGADLPHTFQKQKRESIGNSVVVQFRGDFWGQKFLELPESSSIKQLLALSSKGLKIKASQESRQLGCLIENLEHTTGLRRILKLCECLLTIEEINSAEILSTHEIQYQNDRDREQIEKVIQYTIDAFQQNILLDEVAALINMSVSSFCRYFKNSTKKTYINFLNEVRIGHSCKLLVNTNLSIINICYESGFGTVANFNKQFLQNKQLTPSQYRRQFENKNMS